MSKLNCEVIAYSNGGHVQQILTGYFLLKQENIINLKTKFEKIGFSDINKDKHLVNAKDTHVKVIINEGITIYYDLHDSYEIDIEVLEGVDVYFKRSYMQSYIDSLKESESKKIFELGMNYLVYPTNIDFSSIKNFLRGFNLPFVNTNFPKLKDIEEFSIHKDKIDKKILFMARTWDPYDDKNRAKDKVEERKEINETRASCIRALRKEFGKDFEGGFSNTEYTRKNYKDCIFENSKLTRKREYINYLKQFPICIASTGLHGSIGWKFGEYVSMSKAIITEKLHYSLPGNFTNEKNYLDFTTADECVEQTLKVHSDNNLRLEMMNQNAKYYYQYLRPNSLVLNSILKAIEIDEISQ